MGILNIIKVTDILDILLVSFLIYKILILIKDTRALQLLKGILFLVVAQQLSEWVGFNTLNYILSNAMTLGVIALLVVFQPELRRALEQLGTGSFFGDMIQNEEYEIEMEVRKCIDEVCDAAAALSIQKTGALIIFERQSKLGDVIATGVKIDGLVSAGILRNIFIPNTPLHDGAVVVRKDRIIGAACLLPLTQNSNLNKELGTRHRAALGISENSDCVALVVSEETGVISLALNGKLTRNLNSDSLKQLLLSYILKQKRDKKYKELIKNKISFRKVK